MDKHTKSVRQVGVWMMSLAVSANLLMGLLPAVAMAQTPKTTPNLSPKAVEVLDRLPSITQESKSVVLDSNFAQTKDKTQVILPKRVNEPASIKLENGKNLKINMPVSQKNEVAKKVKEGIVEYGSQDLFGNMAQVTDQGGLRLMTIIKDKKAPETYEYKVNLDGGKVVINEAVNQDGKKGLVILNSDQTEVLAFVDAPWAKDANGKELQTWYTVKGNTIVQTVKHRVVGVVYPVVSDPTITEYFWWGVKYWYNRSETLWIANAFKAGIGAVSALTGLAGNWKVAISSGSVQPFLGDWGTDVYNRGNCLGAQFLWSGQLTWMWEWRGYSTKYKTTICR